MPDIISRIRLEAQGADQVAREIGKIKNAYDDTATSAQGLAGVSVGGGSTDPFQQAVTTEEHWSGSRRGVVGERERRNNDELQKVRQREGEHRSGGVSGRMVSGGVGGTIAMSRGDMLGAGQSGLQAGAGMAMGGGLMKLVPWLLGGAAILGGGKALAQAEMERMKTLYETGLAQQTGQTYTALRNYQTYFGREDIPLSIIRGVTQGAAAGGLFGRGGSPFGVWEPALKDVTRQAERWGADPAAMGQFLARGRRFGLTTEGMTGEGIKSSMLTETLVGSLAAAFGHGRVTDAVKGLAGIMEESMAAGVTEGFTDPMWLQDITQKVTQYAGPGGFNLEGALGIVSKVRAGAGNIESPADVVAMRAWRQPGETLWQAQVRAAQQPKLFRENEFEAVRMRFGGDAEQMARYFSKSRNLSITEAQTYVQTGLAPGIVDPSAAPPPSAFAQRTYGRQQAAWAEGLERGAVELMNSMNDFVKNISDTITGKVAPETPAAQEERVRKEIKDEALLEFIYGVGDASVKQDTTNEILGRIEGGIEKIGKE